MKDKMKVRYEESQVQAREKGTFKDPVLDSSKMNGAERYKSKKGTNHFDIIPYNITTKNHPQKLTDFDYKLDFFVHKGIGTDNTRVLCLNKTFDGKKACPICEARKQLMDAGKKWDCDEVKALKSTRRVMYNVIDLDDPDKGIQLFEMAYAHFEEILLTEAQLRGNVIFFDPENGISIEWRGKEETFNKHAFIKCDRIDFVERDEQYDMEIMDKAISLDSLLIIPTYKEVEAYFMGLDIEEEPEEEEPEKSVSKPSQAAPVNKPKIAEKAKVKEIEEEEESEEIPFEEEEEDEKVVVTPPVKKKIEKSSPSKRKSENKCPGNGIFGKDFQELDQCSNCPENTFNECGEMYEQSDLS